MPEGQQRVGVLAEAPRLLEELGADPAEVAASVGIDVRVLDDPENSIPFTAAGKLLQEGAARCPHFGLLVGQRGDTRSLGLVGRLMRNAPTFGRALQDLADNQRRYIRGAAIYLIARDGVAWVGYAVYLAGTEGADHLRDGAAAIGFNMMRELCGALPDEVLLSRRPPDDARPYRRFFRVPVRFDAEQSALVFPASELERHVPGADFRMRATLEEAVAKYWTVALPNITDQVVRMLRPRVLFGDSTLEAVADSLKMHPRTLNRRLRAERTTFRQLLNEARFDMARQLLAGTRKDVGGISGALGYAETSGFTQCVPSHGRDVARRMARRIDGGRARADSRAHLSMSDCVGAERRTSQRRKRVCWRHRGACRIVEPVINIPRRTPIPRRRAELAA